MQAGFFDKASGLESTDLKLIQAVGCKRQGGPCKGRLALSIQEHGFAFEALDIGSVVLDIVELIHVDALDAAGDQA